MYRTANLQSCILYIYSTNIGTEYFKHGVHSPFFSLQKCGLFHNSNVFGSCIIHILYTGCAKIQKNNSGAKRLALSAVLGLMSSSNRYAPMLVFPQLLPSRRESFTFEYSIFCKKIKLDQTVGIKKSNLDLK